MALTEVGRTTTRTSVVIGAGLVGLACARALQRSGHAVILFDAEDPGSGASSGNAGLIAGSAVVPEASRETLLALPRLLLRNSSPVSMRIAHLPGLAPFLWHFAKACRTSQFDGLSRAMAQLSLNGFDQWMALLDDVPAARALFRRNGCLYLYLDERERRNANKDNDIRRSRGMPLSELSDADVQALLPDLGVMTAGAVLAQSAGHVIDPRALGDLLFRRFVAEGGRYQRQEIVKFELADDRVPAVHTTDGDQIVADTFVLAAGAYSRPLAAQVGAEVPLVTQRGYHLMVHDPGVSVAMPMLIPSAGLAVTPMRNGLRFAGLVEFAGLNSAPNPARTRQIQQCAVRLFPRLAVDNTETWMGRRPSLPDGVPIIDRAPKAANAYLAFGHGQMGLTQAAITGRAIAAIVEGAAPPVDLTPYRATRFDQREHVRRAA